MPRKTDARNPVDWLWIAESDLALVRLATTPEVAFHGCRSKLAEILEKILKAELIRLGWPLEKTHDLDRLLDELVARDAGFAKTFEPLCDAFAEVYFTDRYPGLRPGRSGLADAETTVERRGGASDDREGPPESSTSLKEPAASAVGRSVSRVS